MKSGLYKPKSTAKSCDMKTLHKNRGEGYPSLPDSSLLTYTNTGDSRCTGVPNTRR